MASERTYPHISDELVKYLEKVWPDRHPRANNDGFTLGVRAGALEVIDHVRELKRRQDENMLATRLNASG